MVQYDKRYDLYIEKVTESKDRGLAAAMIRRALMIAKQKNNVQAMRLFVTEGNPAERLYSKLGFMPGPSFSPMLFKVEA